VAGREHAKRISPGFGGGATGWESLACAGWSRAAANLPRPLPAGGFPPALGIGGYSNYATTAALVRKIPGSVSVPYEGSGHVMYLAGNRCMTGHADRYLAELRFLGPERSAGRRADRRSGAEIRDGGGEDVGEPAHLPSLLLPPVREHGPVTPEGEAVGARHRSGKRDSVRVAPERGTADRRSPRVRQAEQPRPVPCKVPVARIFGELKHAVRPRGGPRPRLGGTGARLAVFLSSARRSPRMACARHEDPRCGTYRYRWPGQGLIKDRVAPGALQDLCPMSFVPGPPPSKGAGWRAS